jgi:hypothetical protein
MTAERLSHISSTKRSGRVTTPDIRILLILWRVRAAEDRQREPIDYRLFRGVL